MGNDILFECLLTPGSAQPIDAADTDTASTIARIL
jgi:hypothetical protein